MARTRRIVRPDVPQHVIQRGNNRVDIFRRTSDYEVFLYALRDAAVQYRIQVHHYVLMTNHVHLIATPESATGLAAAMQTLGRRYVRFFNDRYGRTGTLFEGRYKSFEIDTEHYWFACTRYVEFNPVRAGLAMAPDAYRWSSYAVYALGREDLVVTPHAMYLALGDCPRARQRGWRALCGNALTADQLAEIRTSVNSGKPLIPPNLESTRSGV